MKKIYIFILLIGINGRASADTYWDGSLVNSSNPSFARCGYSGLDSNVFPGTITSDFCSWIPTVNGEFASLDKISISALSFYSQLNNLPDPLVSLTGSSGVSRQLVITPTAPPSGPTWHRYYSFSITPPIVAAEKFCMAVRASVINTVTGEVTYKLYHKTLEYIPGDIDNDRKVSRSDLNYFRNVYGANIPVILGEPGGNVNLNVPYEVMSFFDTNHTQHVDNADLVEVRKLYGASIQGTSCSFIDP